MINTDPNQQYSLTREEVENTRLCVKGSSAVKRKTSLLPHPSSIDTSSEYAKIRYSQYLAGAEFDEFTATTLSTLIGKMQFEDITAELPADVEYLEADTDGNGVSLKSLAESCASNALQVNWHLLLTDYTANDDIDLENLSKADVERIKPRAVIRQYNREALVRWNFAKIDGRNQFNYLLLKEESQVLNMQTLEDETVEKYLQLLLVDGEYTQTTFIKDSKGGITQSEEIPEPITINGESLRFIPVEIVSESQVVPGCLPEATGFVGSVSQLALYRYRVSADYKEALSALKPTLNIYGMTKSAWEQFKEVNGRETIANGSSMINVFGKDVRMELLETNQSLQQFAEFFDRNESMVQAIGGIFQTSASVQRTATQILEESRTHTSLLKPLANNIEASLKRVVAYALMFEGKIPQDTIFTSADEVEIKLPREFAVSKLTVEEVKEYRENVMAGLLSQREYLEILKIGGWLSADVDEILLENEQSVTQLQNNQNDSIISA